MPRCNYKILKSYRCKKRCCAGHTVCTQHLKILAKCNLSETQMEGAKGFTGNTMCVLANDRSTKFVSVDQLNILRNIMSTQ